MAKEQYPVDAPIATGPEPAAVVETGTWPESIQTGHGMPEGWEAQYNPLTDAWNAVNPATGEARPILGLDELREQYGIDFDLWPVEAIVGDEIVFMGIRDVMPSKFVEGEFYAVLSIAVDGEKGTHNLAVGGVLLNQLRSMNAVMPFAGTVVEKQGGNGFRYYSLSGGTRAELLARRKALKAG